MVSSVRKVPRVDDVLNFLTCVPLSIRLKHYFHEINKNINKIKNTNKKEDANCDERCEMNSVYKNPFFDPPSTSTSANLEKYIAVTKSDILNSTGNNCQNASNLSPSERQTLKSLKMRS